MTEIDQYFLNRAKSFIPKETINTERPWRIKVDGVFVILPSGKTIWKKIGHAKSALRNALEMPWGYHRTFAEIQGMEWEERAKYLEEKYQNYIKEHVEFVQI